MGTPPIIIVRKKAGHGGHHGGAWKVAYADFVTAMMALFIMLWLMNSSKQIQVAVGGYFKDPTGTSRKVGTNQGYRRRSAHRVVGIGERNIFDSGSSTLNQSGQEMLMLLAGELAKVPNKVSIEGHTDAKPFAGKGNYGNWELSADRANAARRLMQGSGLRLDQVSQVRGFDDQRLRNPKDPTEASNRRISIIVQYTPRDDAEDNETKQNQPGKAEGRLNLGLIKIWAG